MCRFFMRKAGCKMKKIIMIAGALILLAGGGAGGYFFFMAPDTEASTGDQATEGAHGEEVASNDHGSSGDSHGNSGKNVFYYELDPLVLPIVDGYGVSQTVSMVVALEVDNFKSYEGVKDMSPKLTDAYIQEMYGMLNEHAALRSGVIQVGMVKEKLFTITQKVMGDTKVNGVLLQVVQQRPI